MEHHYRQSDFCHDFDCPCSALAAMMWCHCCRGHTFHYCRPNANGVVDSKYRIEAIVTRRLLRWLPQSHNVNDDCCGVGCVSLVDMRWFQGLRSGKATWVVEGTRCDDAALGVMRSQSDNSEQWFKGNWLQTGNLDQGRGRNNTKTTNVGEKRTMTKGDEEEKEAR